MAPEGETLGRAGKRRALGTAGGVGRGGAGGGRISGQTGDGCKYMDGRWALDVERNGWNDADLIA